MTKNTETLVQELLDREAIRTLPAEYCDCVWREDLDGYAALFTADGIFSTSDPALPAGQGTTTLKAMIKGAMEAMRPRPFIHNHVVTLLGPDRAEGRCYVDVRMTRDGRPWLMTGWYHDEYVKVDGSWKFKSRRLTTDFVGPVTA